MKKSKIEKKPALKNLDELVEVLDADKLRQATGGATRSFTAVMRPREDVGGVFSGVQRLVNPADLLNRTTLQADLVRQVSASLSAAQRLRF